MPTTSPAAPAAPRFSIVSAVYNVGRYLDEYIASIEAQTFPLARAEIIMVDDGSSDDSLDRLRAWQQRRPDLVTVLTKPNGGQASARNLGMEHARGEWITFPDPDDVLEPDYFAEVDAFLRDKPETVLGAARRVLFDDETGKQRAHPLQSHFTTRNRLRNLVHDTAHFHGSAPCGFFRLDLLREYDIRFDDRIKPSFEDGNFCCRYLMHADTPYVAFVQSAVYLYRKRSDSSSTLDQSWVDPRRYTDMPRFGFLDLLREGAQRFGTPPVWLQSMVLYELSWYFRVEDAIPWVSTAVRGAVADRFHELMTEIVKYLDPTVVAAYPAKRLTPEYRDLLVHGFRDESWHTPYAVVDKVDLQQRLLRVRYRYTGSAPTASFEIDGAEVRPVHDKVRDLRYFDRVLMKERFAWLPFGTARVLLDGVVADTRMTEPDPPSHLLDSWTMRKEFDPKLADQRLPKQRKLSRKQRAFLRLADSRVVRHRYRRSWVLMDRVHNADDSAEHLFEHLREKSRETNAYFVLERGTPDFKRLRRRHRQRVVPHGTLRWRLLMLNAQHLLSTHIDGPIIKPAKITSLRDPAWRFTFLQHGVIKDDISRWLNPKDLDLFVTSTQAEYDAIAGSDSPYRFTTREVQLTGLPRFDRLRGEAAAYPPERRDLLLVAPTWRNWLMLRPTTDEHRRTADLDRLLHSEFIEQWFGFIRSDEVRALAAAHNLRVGLLLHPNLQSIVDQLELPPHVEALRFEGSNAQAIFARARVFVTDYSSMAFNVAYIDRPLVYFQFDAERFFGGGHAGRKGYFEFERDGFGPVVHTVADTVGAVQDALGAGPDPAEPFRQRIAAAFPVRDGRCCERVAEAVRRSTQKIDPAQWLVTAAERDVPAVGTSPADLVDVASGAAARAKGVDPELESAELIDEPAVPAGSGDE